MKTSGDRQILRPPPSRVVAIRPHTAVLADTLTGRAATETAAKIAAVAAVDAAVDAAVELA